MNTEHSFELQLFRYVSFEFQSNANMNEIWSENDFNQMEEFISGKLKSTY